MNLEVRKNDKDGYLSGRLLLAMPGMGDPRFYRAVILLCAHDEKGAMGLIINHALPGIAFGDLLGQIKVTSDIQVELKSITIPVMSGGPVEGGRGFLLHTGDFQQKDTVRIDDTYSITGTVDALRDIAQGRGPDNLLFILGYAGWGAGQLERELQDNTWLVVDPDPDLIFHTADDAKWERAVRKIGVDPANLSALAGRA